MSETISTSEAVFAKIAAIISTTTDTPVENIQLTSQFRDLGLDSLDALSMISDLEEEYGIKIPNQEILKIKTVGEAVESLGKRIE